MDVNYLVFWSVTYSTPWGVYPVGMLNEPLLGLGEEVRQGPYKGLFSHGGLQVFDLRLLWRDSPVLNLLVFAEALAVGCVGNIFSLASYGEDPVLVGANYYCRFFFERDVRLVERPIDRCLGTLTIWHFSNFRRVVNYPMFVEFKGSRVVAIHGDVTILSREVRREAVY